MQLSSPVLVTGATGQVGGELVHLLQQQGLHYLAPTRAEMDLASPESIRSYVATHKPSWIINPAAYTAVDKAESEVEAATAINATAPGVLGEAAAAIGAPVLHYSTDYVFNGEGTRPWRETDPTGPLGVYGSTKLAGEEALAASGAAHAIFRTSWVYGATGKNFFRTILKFARERESLNIVADQHGAPTWSHDLARVALHTVQRAEATGNALAAMQQFGGVYHACNAGETTWYGFAQKFLQLAAKHEPGTRFATLHPIATAEYPTPARRPANSRMNCELLADKLGFVMPDWTTSLEEVVRQYEQHQSN